MAVHIEIGTPRFTQPGTRAAGGLRRFGVVAGILPAVEPGRVVKEIVPEKQQCLNLLFFGARIVLNPPRVYRQWRVLIKGNSKGLVPPLRVGGQLALR